MRPEILEPLFQPLINLSGVGEKLSPLLHKKLMGDRLWNLLSHIPVGVIDRHHDTPLDQVTDGDIITTKVEIQSHIQGFNRQPYRILCGNQTGFITLLYFNMPRGRHSYLKQLFPEGKERIISGRVEHFQGGLTMPHPDYIARPEEADNIPAHEPIYPLSAGLTNKLFIKLMAQALKIVPPLSEWQNPKSVNQTHAPSFPEALQALHHPNTEADLSPHAPARSRLAYDEILSTQLALALTRRHLKQQRGQAILGTGSLKKSIINALGFKLTQDQEKSLSEIYEDMAAPKRMLRLLQGDVGSGKTVVALLALAHCVEGGGQGALMAPTDLLSRQHFQTFSTLLKNIPITFDILTGRDKGKIRQEKLARLREGKINLLIGTHALFQEDVLFQNLRLAIIDEQHRFGVNQRLALTHKGHATDILVMTATPIPRSLTLTLYGDMDISRIKELPPHRTPVKTTLFSLTRLPEILGALQEKIKTGAKAYWICPLIEESETSDLMAVQKRFEELQKIFPGAVGLVHGKMKESERDKIMDSFSSSQAPLKILVATTVIEVGVNVTDATLMIIEQAERFGLAQLHQLRGRVGRGKDASTCLLLYGKAVSEIARRRLEILRTTNDGFIIAEEDLRCRGAGEILGTRQSGFADFTFADFIAHEPFFPLAYSEAKEILESDPHLTSVRGENLKVLLYLFEQDAAIATLQSG